MTYPIRTVAEKTGLSVHTIRAWEKRYGVLDPVRTETNRRMYRDADIGRLILLQRAVEAGHSIGTISGLSDDELGQIGGTLKSGGTVDGTDTDYLGECRHAMLQLDAEAFEDSLVRASTVLGVDGLLAGVVVPLLGELGQGWEAGSVRIAHEHLATALLRTQLERIRLSLPAPHKARRLLVTTPRGQMHELGALIVAVAAARDGWHVSYLGPNLPAEEIALAANRMGVHAIALSIVYPAVDHELPGELRRLRAELERQLPILVGGRAASNYSEVLKEISALSATESKSVQEALSRLKAASRPVVR